MRVTTKINRCTALLLIGFLLAVSFLFTQGVAAAPQQDPKARALAWLDWELDLASTAVAAAQSDLDQAKAAVAQAQTAIALAQQEKNSAAETIARAALADAQVAVALGERRLANRRAELARVSMIRGYITSGATSFAPRVRGDVTISVGGVRQKWDGRPIDFKPGDYIEAGPNGFASLRVEGEAAIDLAPGGVVQFVKMEAPGASDDKPFAERVMFELRRGLLRATRPPRGMRLPSVPGAPRGSIEYRTPTVIVAVRGTEFELEAGINGSSALIPHSGHMVVQARPSSNAMIKPWWPSPPPPAPLPTGALARVAFAQGEMQIGSATKPPRTAVTGETLGPGDYLQLKSGATAILDLGEQHRIALGQEARFDTGIDTAAGAPLYALKQGRMHVWGTGAAAKLRFLTPNSVIAPAAREFEALVGADRRAALVPVNGSLDVTAVAQRLHWAKMKVWWE